LIIERRRYSIARGQMDRMHDRMQRMLLPMFAQHGIPLPIAIWEDRDGASILTWMIEWPSFDARQALWANFYPHFYAARALEPSEEFVTRTDLTLIAPWTDRPFAFPDLPDACESAWHPQPLIGHGVAFRAAMSGEEAGIFAEAGALTVTISDIVFGPLPMAMVILSWPDTATRREGMARLQAAPAPPKLATALGLAHGALTDAGLWESFDRLAYLPSWRLG
jgi:hypothetical protein